MPPSKRRTAGKKNRVDALDLRAAQAAAAEAAEAAAAAAEASDTRAADHWGRVLLEEANDVDSSLFTGASGGQGPSSAGDGCPGTSRDSSAESGPQDACAWRPASPPLPQPTALERRRAQAVVRQRRARAGALIRRRGLARCNTTLLTEAGTDLRRRCTQECADVGTLYDGLECSHCCAKLFQGEGVPIPHRAGVVRGKHCCSNGQVVLPAVKELPALTALFKQQDAAARTLQRFARKFNNALALASEKVLFFSNTVVPVFYPFPSSFCITSSCMPTCPALYVEVVHAFANAGRYKSRASGCSLLETTDVQFGWLGFCKAPTRQLAAALKAQACAEIGAIRVFIVGCKL